MFVQGVFLALAVIACWAGTPPANNGIVRPCRLSDKGCIASNLAANSRCNPKVRNYLPSKYTLYNVRFETPYFNASYFDNTITFKNNQNCFVSEFFYNINRDTAVLSLDCPLLALNANRTLIQHASKKEDVEYNFQIRAEYPLIRLTTTLRHADKLDICNAFVFGDVTALPIFKIDPLDKPTGNFLSRDLSFFNIYEREACAAHAGSLFRYYVNSYICDFQCP